MNIPCQIHVEIQSIVNSLDFTKNVYISGKPRNRQPRLLTIIEEQCIVDQLVFMSMAGIKVTPALALKMASNVATTKGKVLAGGKGGKGHGWLQRFKLRFKELTEWSILEGVKTIKGPIEDEKSKQNKEAAKFAKRIECILRKYDAQDDLSRVYNVDSVLNISDELSSDSVTCVTATLCICANGTLLPPMLTFAGSVPNGENLQEDGPENALYNTTSNGQVNPSLYLEYVTFLESRLSQKRPIFLFSADKSELVTESLMEFCLEKGMWLINIPKNKVSYFIQPFDNIVPSLIATIETRASAETSFRVDRFKVPWLLKCALSELTEEQIKTSFRDAGLPQAPSTQTSASLEKSEDEHEFASEKCEACKVRLGISGIHCILCGCLYHEACAAKQKGDKTAICKFCLKA